MQSPTLEETPVSTPGASTDEQAMSPAAADDSATSPAVDPLVAHVTRRIGDAILDFKNDLDRRDGHWASAHGKLEIKTGSGQTYELCILPAEPGDQLPLRMEAKLVSGKSATNGQGTLSNGIRTMARPAPGYKSTRRDSDAELEKDLVSRKRRQLDEGEGPNKRQRTDDEDEEDIMPLITKEDLADLLSKLREDVQEDTAECVNHVQKLLRRFKEEWHEKSKWDLEQRQASGLFRDSIAGKENTPGVSFPSPSMERDDQNVSVSDLIRRESKLLSSQIRWVEECRRVAADTHDAREETWRTTSASFHDRQRQDREGFQHRILHESSMHTQTLNQILNEVKAIGLYTQSMKWETPGQFSTPQSYPPQPTAPAFPTQPPIQPRPAQPPPTRGGKTFRGK